MLICYIIYTNVPLWDPSFIKFEQKLSFFFSMHWHIVQAISQHNHICQDCWKNTRSTLECMVILQSKGQGPDSCWKYGTDWSRSFGTCPLDSRITINVHVDMVFLQQSWHISLCWKIARITFQCMVILQSRGQNFIFVEIWWSQDLRVEHTELALDGSKNECARTANDFSSISEVCNGTVSLVTKL